MKTEREILEFIRALYARTGGNPGDIGRIRPLRGGWYNALKYQIERFDRSIAVISREDVDSGNEAAIVAAFDTFVVSARDAFLCSACGTYGPGGSRYCSRCGNLLGAPYDRSRSAQNTRTLTAARYAALTTALSCLAAGVAYWCGVSRPVAQGPLMQHHLELAVSPAALDQTAQKGRASSTAPTEDARVIRPSPSWLEVPNEMPNDPHIVVASSSAPHRAYTPRGGSGARPKTAHTKVGSRNSFSKKRIAGDGVLSNANIDVTYAARAHVECPTSISGLVCREKLRIMLCKGTWTAAAIPGRMICHIREFQAPLS